MGEVPAHDQSVTHHYAIRYPEHPARESDPHYRDFEEFRRRTKDTAQCAIGAHRGDFSECSLDKPLELHHAHVEFSLQNGVDLAWLEKDYPGISNPNEVGAWVESADNLMWLCVLPGVPVLMADGTERSIENVQVGDLVVSAEGNACPVTAVAAKRYRGEVARFGTAALTLSHRMRVPGGWAPAGEVAEEIGMLGAEMVSVRSVKQQVLAGVVSAVSVDVVDSLAAQQWAPDDLLHDPSVLHLEPSNPASVHHHADVTLRREVASGSVLTIPRHRVETCDAADVGAESVGSGTPVCRSMEGRVAGLAAYEMVWVAPVAPTIGLFSGYVHDLNVAHDHSFIAGGVAVHNCEFHHRGHGGVHVASASDFEAEKYVRRLIS